MAKLDIAIDLGTAYTSIFVSGNGIVLHEPSVVAFYDNGGGRRSVRAVGSEAARMIGKAPEKTVVVSPLEDGIVKDAEACKAMMGEFIKRILPESYILKPRIRAILGVPIGITVDERKVYEEILMSAGVDEISMVNAIMMAAIGVELPVADNYGGFIVSIGAGGTEIAVPSLCGLVTGCAINVGGNMIDETIVSSFLGVYQLTIDKKTARLVKEKICSLIRNDRSAMQVSGIDIRSNKITTRTVSADQLYDAVAGYYNEIINAVGIHINSSSPAVAAEIQKNGITVVGGGANIPGLRELMTEVLGLPVRLPHSPQYATITGGGMLLNDPYLLDDIMRHC